ncbi:MAG: hypothetical protein WBA17_15135 [Saprospiraceae bacterium]
MPQPIVFFSGATAGSGYEAYPNTYHQLVQPLDTSTHKDVEETFLYIREGYLNYYVYRVSNVNTLAGRGGRTGSNFCVWLGLDGFKFNSFDERHLNFFRKIFEDGIIKSGDVLGFSSKDKLHHFTVNTLSEKANDLSRIAAGAVEIYHDTFKENVDVVTAEWINKRTQQILREVKAPAPKPQLKPVPRPQPIPQPVPVTGNLAEQVNALEERVNVLGKQANFTSVLVLVLAGLLALVLAWEAYSYFRETEEPVGDIQGREETNKEPTATDAPAPNATENTYQKADISEFKGGYNSDSTKYTIKKFPAAILNVTSNSNWNETITSMEEFVKILAVYLIETEAEEIFGKYRDRTGELANNIIRDNPTHIKGFLDDYFNNSENPAYSKVLKKLNESLNGGKASIVISINPN